MSGAGCFIMSRLVESQLWRGTVIAHDGSGSIPYNEAELFIN